MISRMASADSAQQSRELSSQIDREEIADPEPTGKVSFVLAPEPSPQSTARNIR